MDKPVYFISDLHLGARHLAPTIALEHERQRRIVKFLRQIQGGASALYLMGDILDYWYEYRTVAPRGFVRFLGALAELADHGCRITWMIGNHDIWLFDYLREEVGLRVVKDDYIVEDILGRHFLLSHGDGVGPQKRLFRIIRGMFRSPFLQWLYAGIHPRWTIAFANKWSAHSRMAENSTHIVRLQQDAVRNLRDFCLKYLELHPSPEIDYFIFGHVHTVVDEPLTPPLALPRMIVLGDWISHFTYGCFDGTNMSLQAFPA